MSSLDEDMDDCERRDPWGFPLHSPVTRPSAVVNAGGAPVNARFEQNTDNSTNKPLPWIAYSWFLSGAALMGLLISVAIVALWLPGIIDAKVEARVARAEAIAELARRDSSIAKDMVDLDRAKEKAREEMKNVR